MLTDDDFEDYFVEPDPEPESDPEPRQEAGGRRVIEFGEPSPREDGRRESHEDSHGRQSGCMSRWLLMIAAVVVVALGGIGYFRYLSPCVDDAVMDVYVTGVQRRGVVFKTMEADVVVADRLVDTVSAYTHPVGVTVADDMTAHRLQSVRSTGRAVRIRYRQYSATLPWRGESKIVVTGIEPAVAD